MVNRYRHLVLVAVVLLAAGLVRWGQADESPTEDEWAHLTRGIAIWTTGDTRLSYAHPPLANAIVTAGIAIDGDAPDVTRSSGWTRRVDPGTVALDWIRRDYDSAREHLMQARRAMTWFFVVGLVYVYWWCTALFGWPAGVAAAILFGFNPTIIAQARYVTTDLPAAVTIMVAVGEFIRHAAGRSGWRTTWITVPLALGAAILTKHSALLLVPILGGAGLVLALCRVGWFSGLSRGRAIARWALHLAGSGALVLLTINVGYGFQESGMTVDEVLERPEPQYWISKPYKGEMLETVTPLAKLPGSVRVPVPYTELFGLGCIAAQNARGYPLSTFFGEPTRHGHVLYFPTLLLFRTPIVVLVLLASVVPLAFRRRFRLPLTPVLLLVAVAGAFLLMAMRAKLNMGVRHALPVEVFLAVVAAVVATAWWRDDRVCQIARPALGLGAVFLVASTVMAGPHYLGWYNGLIGRDRGHDISAVGDDWGQDRAALVELAQRERLEPLYYGHQTRTRQLEVRHLGLEYTPLRCKKRPPAGAWVAVHRLRLQAAGQRCYPYLEDRRPQHVVNDHILVYRMPDRAK